MKVDLKMLGAAELLKSYISSSVIVECTLSSTFLSLKDKNLFELFDYLLWCRAESANKLSNA